MIGHESGAILRQMQALLDVGTFGGLSDRELLERFLERRDEVAELAFAVLVERHGPMVLGVCRRIMRDLHHAEDAFQATFLVLARKGAIDPRGGLARALALRRGHAGGHARPERRTSASGPRTIGARSPRHRGSGPRPGRYRPCRDPGDDRAGDRRAPRPVPGPRAALRPGRPELRGGGPPAGLAGGDRQEPAVAGPGQAARAADPPRPGTGRVLDRDRHPPGRPPAEPGRGHDPRRSCPHLRPADVRLRRLGLCRDPHTRSAPHHGIHQVQGRRGGLADGRDRFGGPVRPGIRAEAGGPGRRGGLREAGRARRSQRRGGRPRDARAPHGPTPSPDATRRLSTGSWPTTSRASTRPATFSPS